MLSTSGSLKAEQLEALKQFISNPQGAASFLAIPGFQSYAPQSGQIFGILEQLKKDFSDSLADAQAEEAKAKKAFDMLKAAKLEEIATAKKAIADMDIEIADTKEKHAVALEEYEDTQKQLEMDKEFLADLIKKCEAADEEFAIRVKDRTTEIAAVEDTIAILNTDESFDVAEQTLNRPTAFLQIASAEGREEQQR